jgi:hypothetical protein
MPRNPQLMPTDTPLVETDRRMNFDWVQFWSVQQEQLASSALIVVDKSEGSVNEAAIGATSLNVGTTTALYRISVIARITRAATSSSSLGVTIRWTTGGVALNKTWTALTGNTTTTYLAESVPVRIDSTTSLTYETAYSSTGATAMQYSLEVAAERLA